MIFKTQSKKLRFCHKIAFLKIFVAKQMKIKVKEISAISIDMKKTRLLQLFKIGINSKMIKLEEVMNTSIAHFVANQLLVRLR